MMNKPGDLHSQFPTNIFRFESVPSCLGAISFAADGLPLALALALALSLPLPLPASLLLSLPLPLPPATAAVGAAEHGRIQANPRFNDF